MAEARIYLRNLIEHAIQPRFVYVHHWQSHGPVMWDNRQTMHHVRRFAKTEGLRDICRTAISSDGSATPQVIQI
jgi:alpha-ketoglutarate-dependent 2,4-dichlorophenoxyacetate dioxygenase